jgi:hypothetical protein
LRSGGNKIAACQGQIVHYIIARMRDSSKRKLVMVTRASASNLNIPATVDAFGALKAKIADLLEQKEEMEQSMADLPAGSYEGKKYRMSISDCVRQSLADWMLSGPLSPQFIAAHTKYTDYRLTRVALARAKTSSSRQSRQHNDCLPDCLPSARHASRRDRHHSQLPR